MPAPSLRPPTPAEKSDIINYVKTLASGQNYPGGAGLGNIGRPPKAS